MRNIKKSLFLLMLTSNICFAQSLQKGDVILNGNIGVPHLYKNIIKIAVNRDAFKEYFEGKLEVSDIKGLNPIAIKGEYGVNDYFGIGFSTAFWSISLDVKDYYNIQNQSQGTTLQDSLDIYSFRIDSKSYGIRPNFHLPIENRNNDFFIGLGLGITKNKLTIGFSSTDAGRLATAFGKDLQADLSLPGGFYFAPSIGYRHYFGENFGFNFELGYEKGAIVQAGLAVRFNMAKK